jgi:hypothetical protein
MDRASSRWWFLDPREWLKLAYETFGAENWEDESFAVITDAAGFYSDPQVAPGMYTISVTAAGFGTLVRQPDVEVRVNDRLRIDLALQVGEVSQTVAVHGSAPLLQTEDATEGQVIDHKRVTDLPLNGRN